MSSVISPIAGDLTPEQRFEAGMLKCAAYYLVDPVYMGQPMGSRKDLKAYSRVIDLIEDLVGGSTEEFDEPRVPKDLGELVTLSRVQVEINQSLTSSMSWVDRNVRANGPVDQARSFLNSAHALARDPDFRVDHVASAVLYGQPVNSVGSAPV